MSMQKWSLVSNLIKTGSADTAFLTVPISIRIYIFGKAQIIWYSVLISVQLFLFKYKVRRIIRDILKYYF